MAVIFVVEAVAFEALIDAGIVLGAMAPHAHDLVKATCRRRSRFFPELSR